MSDSTRDRVTVWLVALVCGVAGFAVAQGFSFSEASPVEALLPAVEHSVSEIDAIVSVRAESLREQVAHLPVRKEDRPATPAVVTPQRSEPVRPTKSPEEIRVEGVDYRVLYEDFRSHGASSFACSWKFTLTNYGEKPFENTATFAFLETSGNVVVYDLVVVHLKPGETRSYRDTIDLEERVFRRVARTGVSFE